MRVLKKNIIILHLLVDSTTEHVAQLTSKNICKYFDFSFFVCIFAFAFADMAQLVEQRIRNA